MTQRPDITVLMPMRNAEAYVAEALHSVLSQDEVSLEVVVVDDASADHSREIVESMRDPRIHVIESPARGVAAVFNAGLDAARAPILARCDADDLYVPHRLAWQLNYLAARPQYVAVCGTYSTLTEAGTLLAEMDTGQESADISGELRSGVTRTHMCTFATRTQTLRDIGGCRSYFITSSDIDLQLRIGHAGLVRYEPHPCYLYRLHDDSITHTRRSGERTFFDQTAREFSRQRNATGADDLDLGVPPTPPTRGSSAPLCAADQMQNILRGCSWKEHRRGHKWKAIALGIRACSMCPRNFTNWRSLAALMIKRPRMETAP